MAATTASNVGERLEQRAAQRIYLRAVRGDIDLHSAHEHVVALEAGHHLVERIDIAGEHCRAGTV